MSLIKEGNDLRGLLVQMGLGQPSSRAFVVGSIVGTAAFLSGFPAASFREDGSIKPAKLVSHEPDATNTHFLLVPLAAAAAAYLFT